MRSPDQGPPAGGRPTGSSDEFTGRTQVDASLRQDRGHVPSDRLGPGPHLRRGRASFPRHHAGPQTRCPPKSSGGLSLRGRLVLPSVTSSPRRGGAAVEATHRRPAAVPSEPCQRGRCSPGQVCPSRDVPTIAASSGRSHAGFVPHRESADLGGHKRSRWVRRSRRSQHLPAPDLGRPSTWTRLRVPPHLLFRSTG
jgi:hypothetical protein